MAKYKQNIYSWKHANDIPFRMLENILVNYFSNSRRQRTPSLLNDPRYAIESYTITL